MSSVRPGGKYHSIRHAKISEIQTGIFGRMEHAHYPRHQAPRAQCHFSLNWTSYDPNSYGPPFWWLRVASWRCFTGFIVYREIHVHELGVFIWRLDSIFAKKKSCWFWVDRSRTLSSTSYLAILL